MSRVDSLFILFVCAVLASPAGAQVHSIYGSIVGTVTDQSGAVIPGVAVTATNPCLKVDFQGSRVTSDGALILVCELDERPGFGELIEQHLTGPRRGNNTQFPLADLLRQSVYGRLAGYEDVNDAERLS